MTFAMEAGVGSSAAALAPRVGSREAARPPTTPSPPTPPPSAAKLLTRRGGAPRAEGGAQITPPAFMLSNSFVNLFLNFCAAVFAVVGVVVAIRGCWRRRRR